MKNRLLPLLCLLSPILLVYNRKSTHDDFFLRQQSGDNHTYVIQKYGQIEEANNPSPLQSNEPSKNWHAVVIFWIFGQSIILLGRFVYAHQKRGKLRYA